MGVRVRDTFGTHTLVWGSDYPHTESTFPRSRESTFPRSREVVAETLADVPAGEQQMILRDNCAALYGFDLSFLASDLSEWGGAHRFRDRRALIPDRCQQAVPGRRDARCPPLHPIRPR